MDDYAEFLRETKQKILDENKKGLNDRHFWFAVGSIVETGVDPVTLRAFRKYLKESPAYGNGQEDALKQVNEICDTDFSAWDEIYLTGENYFNRRSISRYKDGYLRAFHDFKLNANLDPVDEFWPDIEGEFIAMLRRDYGHDLEKINEILGTRFNSWDKVHLTDTVPLENPRVAEAWERFVKEEINLDFVSLD